MPVSLHFRFCVRCYEPHKKPWSYCIHVTKKRIFQILAAFIFYLKSTFSALALECEGSSGKCEVWSVKEAVGSEKCEVWSVKFKFGVRSAQCEVWGLECEGSSGKCEVWSAKCEVWSVECEVSSSECEECSVKCGVWRLCFVSRWKNQTVVEVWSAKRAVWSVRFGVWRKQWEVRSVKCEVRSVKFGVWSFKFGVRRVQCEVWSVKTLLCLSLKKSNGCRGKDTVGTGCLWTIGHLCLGNFRRRLARVYVIICVSIYIYIYIKENILPFIITPILLLLYDHYLLPYIHICSIINIW